MSLKKIRIGTRGSALAMWQAKHVESLLLANHLNLETVLVPIETQGDLDLNRSISDIGGKGIFLKEIEQALLANKIDIAVHSFKDITAIPSPKLTYSGFILEEAVTDAFILFNNRKITDDNLKIATGSLRRKALCQVLYPNIQCHDIRGNIQTRIQRAKDRGDDGVLLSTAGLQRLNLTHLIHLETNPEEFIPAPGQGIIAIQQRSNDPNLSAIIQKITQSSVNDLALKYYALLQGVDFNCQVPFGAYFNQNKLCVFMESKFQRVHHQFSLEPDLDLKRLIAWLVSGMH
ncbi:MAG: hydroxymethylbilane synthase [Candidatus Margulisiibacteriota bacterium]